MINCSLTPVIEARSPVVICNQTVTRRANDPARTGGSRRFGCATVYQCADSCKPPGYRRGSVPCLMELSDGAVRGRGRAGEI